MMEAEEVFEMLRLLQIGITDLLKGYLSLSVTMTPSSNWHS
jgi:hypothetical protein